MRMNPSSIKIRVNGGSYDTGMRKLGAILGDDTEVGCNTVLNPGTLLEKAVTVYPGITARGYYFSGTVIKESARPEGPLSLKRAGIQQEGPTGDVSPADGGA
jgi:hypothetical protein